MQSLHLIDEGNKKSTLCAYSLYFPCIGRLILASAKNMAQNLRFNSYYTLKTLVIHLLFDLYHFHCISSLNKFENIIILISKDPQPQIKPELGHTNQSSLRVHQCMLPINFLSGLIADESIVFIIIIMKESSSSQLASGYAKSAILILLLVGLVGFTVVSVFNKQEVELDPVVAFAFDTYCPIDSSQSLAAINQQLALQGIPPLSFDYKLNPNIYVVNVQSRPSDPNNPNSSAMLYYCGMAKQWWEGSCSNARFICSIPGPMFYFPVKQQATIIWVNGINFQGLNYTHANCYDQETSTDHDCTVTTKPAEWENCTYFQPTDYQYSHSQTHRLTKDAIPISPHIHGLEVRPVFDGNPLAWFTPDGLRGPGFQTLYNQRYFSQFVNVDSFKGKDNWEETLKKRTKVIKVNNDQAPGLLFYHDHAMKSTLYNVQFGLGGLWVISDPKVEANLPSGKYEKFIVFSKQGDARTKGVLLSPDAHAENDAVPEFQRSATYRFRILNAAFDNVFNNVVFAAYYTIEQVDGQYTYTEIDPSNTTYDLDSNKHLIPFTVIGTDTTLFHQSINDVTFMNFGPAERVDLLIRFDVQLPSNINNVYFVCDDMNQGATVIKYQFNIEKKPQTLFQHILQVLPNKDNIFTINQGKIVNERVKLPRDYKNLNIPFTNLSSFPQAKVAVRRHRPLFSLPFDTRFMIGAHYMFEDGATDLPKIGTVDDFYMINNLWEDHPMHIHLINHQAVKAYSLKRLGLPDNRDCTLYFLDFFRLSGLEEFQGLNNIDLCHYIWDLEEPAVLDLFMRLKNYMSENKVEITENGLISGLDVMAHSNGDQAYLIGNCTFDSTHKYICEETPNSILDYESRWKDTTMVHSYSVFVLRVRWASTLYDQKVRPYPFFNIPEEHLVEFPGFVYHCHILPHEDNEMMRSFALQYSDIYKSTISPWVQKISCSRNNWLDQMKCINDKLGCKTTK